MYRICFLLFFIKVFLLFQLSYAFKHKCQHDHMEPHTMHIARHPKTSIEYDMEVLNSS
jgi:hypothetical protein